MSARLTRTIAAAASVAFVLGCPPAHAQEPVPAGSQRVALPDTPIGRTAREWLDAFNSGDSVQLGAYYRKYALQRSMDVQLSRRRSTGGYDVVSVEKSEPRLLEVVLKERSTGNLAFGVTELSDEGAPLGLKQSAIVAVPTGASVADFKIDAAGRTRVIEAANAKLDTNYVFPDVAKRMADTVRARLKRGEYDGVTNGISFAGLLTEQYQQVSHDKHLRVNFSARRVPDRAPNATPDSVARERFRKEMESVNCGFEKSEQLPGKVGYLKFNFFADPEVCGATATSAMQQIADVEALIIDLRENGGGDPAMVAYVSSYLFSKRTHLNDLWTRRTNETNEYWTRPEVPGKKVRDEVPVYVLTASRTFSGAEEFTYNLKNLKRATIVGETTGGGAHPVSGHKIDEHFQIGVPFARAINPISKTNWEGTGVVPDVKVPAAEALVTAQRMIAERRGTP